MIVPGWPGPKVPCTVLGGAAVLPTKNDVLPVIIPANDGNAVAFVAAGAMAAGWKASAGVIDPVGAEECASPSAPTTNSSTNSHISCVWRLAMRIWPHRNTYSTCPGWLPDGFNYAAAFSLDLGGAVASAPLS